MSSIKDKCAIAGIGQSEFLVNSGRDRLSLALEAITNAVEDAGLSVKDIDGIVRYTIDASASVEILAANLGLPNVTYWGETYMGGGSACASVAHAALAVAGGMANCVVCYRAFTPFDFLDGARHNSSTLWARDSGAAEFLRPFGWFAMLDNFAMCFRRHMYEYGTTSRQLGAIAAAFRKHSSMNPKAIRRTPITVDDHQNSPIISDPIRELDCMIAPNDGACAVVVTSAERAKDLKQRPAYITAAAQALGSDPPLWWEFWPFRPVVTEWESKYLAPGLFNMAGVTPEDIDVAEIYDCFTYTALVQLEDYGFCKKGEGGPFVEAGNIELGGKLPVNTHGGHIGEAYVHGFTHILEGARQIRGTSTAQVKDAELALVTGGVPAPTSALILRRK